MATGVKKASLKAEPKATANREAGATTVGAGAKNPREEKKPGLKKKRARATEAPQAVEREKGPAKTTKGPLKGESSGQGGAKEGAHRQPRPITRVVLSETMDRI